MTFARISIGFLASLGGVSLVLVATAAAYVGIHRIKETKPSNTDLAYILNWGSLSTYSKIEKVSASCVTPRNPVVGDETKVYTFQLSPVPEAAWNTEEMKELWQRGPLTEPLLVQAMSTATLFARSAGCGAFPELNSARFFLSFPQVTAYDRRVEAVQVTAYDTQTNELYHADVRW